ncbi:hypothetical protein [Thermocoleostomius sinensis]|uniref:Uncharacterized protein n=1 Tax=Thermocoleostomius sinensis A174 TaxID=2016057 RepID=A0A9E8ZHF0_9CYAN|nr:hypothetical protein [Thermocoleostomius sinensis]WAL58571.1 hypothetical protein OXH18_15445 [Thermocoleostomius sinensis A174]
MADQLCSPTARTHQSVATALLAQRRTVLLRRYRKGRPSTTPHSQSPVRFWDHRSPLAIALTNHVLGAFAITANPQTTASTDNLLGGFGLTDHAKERVQGLAYPTDNPQVRRGFKAENESFEGDALGQ